MIRALADFELVRVLPPSVFWPRPKVDSAVIAITPSPEKRALIGDLPLVPLSVVRQLFLHPARTFAESSTASIATP